MVDSKAALYVTAIFIFLLALYSLANLLISNGSVEDENEISEVHNTVIEPSRTEITQNEYWNGLPISNFNVLYVHPSNQTKELTKRYVEDLETQYQDLTSTSVSIPIYSKYRKEIGINGLVDGLVELEKKKGKIASIITQYLGEYTFAEIGEWGSVKDGIEVLSRPLLENSPLNGYVWQAIVEFSKKLFPNSMSGNPWSATDLDSLSKFITDDLCFFKNKKHLFHTYQSCVIGVGHALSYIFNKSQVNDAISICGKIDDLDFNYQCAFGVFSAAISEFPKFSFSPCDTNDFPAVCFRSITSTFRILEEDHIQYPCDFLPNRYHKIGCVWGESFNAKTESSYDVYEFCEKYESPYVNGYLFTYESDWKDTDRFHYRVYLSCIDGYLSAKNFGDVSKEVADITCKQFHEKNTQNFCLDVHSRLEIPDSLKYNYALLEYDYDSTISLQEVDLKNLIKASQTGDNSKNLTYVIH